MNERIHCIIALYQWLLERNPNIQLLQLKVLKRVPAMPHFIVENRHPPASSRVVLSTPVQTFDELKVLISDKSSCVYDPNKLFAFPRESFKLSFACHLPSSHLSHNTKKIKTKRRNMRHRRIVMFFICRRQSDEKLIP